VPSTVDFRFKYDSSALRERGCFCPGVLYCITCPRVCLTAGNGVDDVFWLHDGIIFAIGRACYKSGIRIQADDVDMYDVVIEYATEADQGLYQCQAHPSGFCTAVYLWVDGRPIIYSNLLSKIISVDNCGIIAMLFSLFR